MAEIRDPKRPVNQNNRPNNPNNKGVKPPKSRYIIYIVYGLLFVGIFFLWNGSSKVEPIKKEWLDIKEEMSDGDIDKIVFIRNERRGEVTIKKDSLDQSDPHDSAYRTRYHL